MTSKKKPKIVEKINKIIYIDMDDTLCDFRGSFLLNKLNNPSVEYPQSIDGFFLELEPIDGALKAVRFLDSYFDVYILTAPSVMNPYCYRDKRLWIERYFGLDFCNKLIITPHKNLNKGDYLIDDNNYGKGQDKFEGELIQFGSDDYQDWDSILEYFCEKYYI